ncbi:DUF6030 family protein [Mesorhizobium sp. LHD-90]|uniref:DUF6030 family protein n=1 Tax=Mesorhizobium sp. LHD-90 TaxID=3071414 RepID=UPI0027E0443A|nr:DUF6030 family protein [Mesorhizobium sp. LHD-90]MDQ6434976.1 DUF6030 family protein [Mesorhizobium sp. LHD-90]
MPSEPEIAGGKDARSTKARAILLPLMGLSLVLPVVALVSMMPEAAPRQDPVQTVITLSDQPVTVTKAIPAAPGPARFRPGFLSFRADNPHPFRPLIGWDPERICDSLDGAGFANLGWKGAEVAGTGWECMARTDEADIVDTMSNSLFYMLRGRGGQRIGNARLKINLPDPANGTPILEQAQEFVRFFSEQVGLSAPTAILRAIRDTQPAKVVLRDATYTLKREFGDIARFNLSIDFGPSPYSFYQTADLDLAPAPIDAGGDAKGPRLRQND